MTNQSVMTHKRTARFSSYLSESALVNELADGLEVGVPVGHVRLHQTQHLDGRGVELHEHRVVDLAKAEELQDLAHLGGDADDTADADHEHHTGLWAKNAGVVYEWRIMKGVQKHVLYSNHT